MTTTHCCTRKTITRTAMVATATGFATLHPGRQRVVPAGSRCDFR
jgi:hypothetical protein